MWKWAQRREWLLILLAGVVILRIPSLFEPYWYGDEGVYLTIGRAVTRGVPLYKGIHDNKPPFLYLLAAAAGGNQFWFKFMALVWGIATVAAFASLAEIIWKEKKKAVVTSTVVFAALSTLPLWEGNIANAELFFLLPSILAWKYLWSKNSVRWTLVGGLLLGLGALFKMPVALEAGVWPVVWWIKKDKDWFKRSVVLAFGVLIPIAISGGYFAAGGAIREYWTAAWAQNLPYLSSWKTETGMGIYSLKGRALVLAGIAAVLIWLRKKLGRVALAIGWWWAVTLFAALLSGRPYPHYLLQAAPATALGVGLLVSGERAVGIGGIVLIGLILGVFKFWAYPVAGYYKNFGEWIWGKKTTQNYYDWFGSAVGRNYEIAKLIKSESGENDKVFIWGDEPMIYALAQRGVVGKYTVRYHVLGFEKEAEIIAELEKNPPKFIVSLDREDELPGLKQLIMTKYWLEKEVDGAKIFRRKMRLGLYN